MSNCPLSLGRVQELFIISDDGQRKCAISGASICLECPLLRKKADELGISVDELLIGHMEEQGGAKKEIVDREKLQQDVKTENITDSDLKINDDYGLQYFRNTLIERNGRMRVAMATAQRIATRKRVDDALRRLQELWTRRVNPFEGKPEG